MDDNRRRYLVALIVARIPEASPDEIADLVLSPADSVPASLVEELIGVIDLMDDRLSDLEFAIEARSEAA